MTIPCPFNPPVDLPVLRTGEAHIFFLPRVDSWQAKQYRVNGQVVPGGEHYSTAGLPVVEELQRTKVNVLAKSTVEGLPDLPMTEYMERKDALGPTEEPSFEGDARRFRDLDAEYAYRRFMQSYDVITREDWTLVQTFNPVVTERVEAPNPFIVPHRHLGAEITSQVATYNRQGYIIDLVSQILTANGFGNEETDKSKPKALTFKVYTYEKDRIQVYVAGSKLFEVPGWGSFKDTMVAAIARMTADKAMVERELNFFLAGRAQNLNAVMMAAKLEGIKAMVHKIDSKQATALDKRALLSHLDEQIARLKAMDLPSEELASSGNAPALSAG